MNEWLIVYLAGVLINLYVGAWVYVLVRVRYRPVPGIIGAFLWPLGLILAVLLAGPITRRWPDADTRWLEK